MNIKKIFTVSGYLILLFLALFLFSISKDLAELAELAYSGAGQTVFLFLITLEIVGFLYLLYPVFFPSKRLLLKSNSSKEEQELFKKMLINRLRHNSILKQKGLSPLPDINCHINAPTPNLSAVAKNSTELSNMPTQALAYSPLNNCLNALDAEAEKEIMAMAKRIFVGTSLSQNGRLDAIIVFIGLCKTIWSVSKIYNHSPHPLELLSIYRAVGTSTFLAFSFEELDLGAEISGSFAELSRSLAPAIGSAQIPFVGNMIQKITGSCIDGAANSFLLIRVGLLTRNAYKYRLNEQKMPTRGQVFAEAGGLLKGMSSEAVKSISASIKKGFVKFAQKNANEYGEACSELSSKTVSKSYMHIKKGLQSTKLQLKRTVNIPFKIAVYSSKVVLSKATNAKDATRVLVQTSSNNLKNNKVSKLIIDKLTLKKTKK